MNEKEKYSADIRSQIFDKEKWCSDHYAVFGHEASSGKSQETMRFLGEFTRQSKVRVLFVQIFKKDGALLETANKINEHANSQVAFHFDSESPKNHETREQIKNAQILVVTHQMAKHLFGNPDNEMVQNRDILIIDEFPAFFLEPVHLSIEEIGMVWVTEENDSPQLQLANKLKELFFSYKSNKEDQRTIPLVSSSNPILKDIQQLMLDKSMRNQENDLGKIFEKIEHILENPAFIYENSFQSFSSKTPLKLFKNNIILDANADLDYRYQLSNSFNIHLKECFFDYTDTTIIHYNVCTSKQALKGLKSFNARAFQEINLESLDRTLIITDMENVDRTKKAIDNHFNKFSNSAPWEHKIEVTYFGNIIGVNTFRDFNSVVILKTPIHPYNSYLLNYLRFTDHKESIKQSYNMFEDEDIERIKISSTTGEIYQAVKRVNRDNTQKCNIFIFSDEQDSIDLMLPKFPNATYLQKSFSSESSITKFPKKKTITAKKSEALIKELSMECAKGMPFRIAKKDISDRIELDDRKSFHRVIKEATEPLKGIGIVVSNRHFEFNPIC